MVESFHAHRLSPLLLQEVGSLQWEQYAGSGNDIVRNGNRGKVVDRLLEKMREWKVPTKAGEIWYTVLMFMRLESVTHQAVASAQDQWASAVGPL